MMDWWLCEMSYSDSFKTREDMPRARFVGEQARRITQCDDVEEHPELTWCSSRPGVLNLLASQPCDE